MSSTAQFHFAAEFVAFLAAAAGLSLVLLRGELLTRVPWARTALGLGFTAIGTAAFFRGSLLLGDIENELLLMVRAAGLVAVAVGSLNWTGGQGARRLLWLGITAMAASLVLDIGTTGRPVDTALGVGAVGVTASVLSASRRSIAARVAASAALALLLMVLVLSLALSAVLSSTIEDEALRSLDGRIQTEVSQLESQPRQLLPTANLAAEALSTTPITLQELLRLEQTPEPSPAIAEQLRQLSEKFTNQLPLAYLSADRRVLAVHKFDAPTAQELSGTDAVKQAIEQKGLRGSIDVVNGKAFAMGVVPVQVRSRDVTRLIGLVVAGEPLDNSYLEIRANEDPGLSLALTRQSEVIAEVRALPPFGIVRPLVATAINTSRAASTITEERFIVARPVRRADNQPVMALVASRPTTVVDETREKLFRTLFLIALGGTLLALLIAALVGDRIGAGVRRLTVAAEDIQRGDLTVRAGLASEDEIGVLSSAFDSMAESIEEKTGALRQAADDETRLRNRLEAVVAGMGEALVAVDSNGRITDFNQAAEELLGIHADEARGQPADEVIELVSDDGDDLGARLRKPLPRRWGVLGSVKQRDGDLVPVALSAGALRGAGAEVAGGVFVLRDLTKEREVERMKNEFLSRVNHELRTPLTPMIGYTELLLRKNVAPAKARELYTDILKSGHSLLRKIEMVEFFTKTGAGGERLDPQRIELRPLIQEVVEEWSEKSDGHSVTSRIGRSTPEVVADVRWLRVSIDELVNNATKFSPGGGKITVAASSANNGSGQGVEIVVSDEGIGMSNEEQERVFTPFEQVDASDTRAYGGLGIGLAFVKRVAEVHGGSVTVKSRPGKGSKVSIFLPAAPKTRRRR